MKYSSKQRGAVSVLAIVLVLVVVAAVGFAVYNVSKARNTDTQSVNTSSSPASSPTSTASPAATPANMFVVKELGVQFAISGDLKDLVYTVRDLGAGKKAADFSTTSLINAGQSCATDQSHSLLGSILVTSDANVTTSEKVKAIGSQYLYYSHPQAACSNSDNAASLTASFRNALNSAEAAQ
jgi:hypothetical protein